MTVLHATRFWGGKSALMPVGRWIASLLPAERKATYVEPFAGMLGVLLHRPKVAIEIANDLNGRVVNWWLAVRDHREEFGRLIVNTPYSRQLFDDYLASLDEGAPLERAVKFHLVVCASQNAGDAGAPGFGLSYTDSSPAAKMHNFANRIDAISNRVRDVQLDCRDAVEVLHRTQHVANAVIYCDPPYEATRTEAYSVAELDRDELFKSLQRQQGRVAISGYGDQWDHLGWHRSELQHQISAPGIGDKVRTRTEVLWMNYKPVQQGWL